MPGQARLRFLGNHDTVSWTWDRARATQVYGVERAKGPLDPAVLHRRRALPVSGDELSSIYDRRSCADLRPFFKALFAARASSSPPT